MDNLLSKRFFSWSAGRRSKRVFMFSEGSAGDTNLLGYKGSNLCDMFRMELPVPPGFVISCDSAREFATISTARDGDKQFDDLRRAIKDLEKATSKRFGITDSISGSTAGAASSKKESLASPLMLSVRASSTISMPGVVEAVLHVGINDDIVQRICAMSDAHGCKWAYDTHRRFLQTFGHVVFGIDEQKYKSVLANERLRAGVSCDSDLSITQLQNVISEFKRLASIPDDPYEQLQLAIQNVYKTWGSMKAASIREAYNVTEDVGIAVVVQCMAYGNKNELSGVGCAMSRDPNSGVRSIVAEFAPCTAGDDVFATTGIIKNIELLREQYPQLTTTLVQVVDQLEAHYHDIQDVQFVIEDGNVYILQSTSTTRSPYCALKCAVSMVDEKLISEREALMRIDAMQMTQCQSLTFQKPFADPQHKEEGFTLIGKGVCASFGAAVGQVVFHSFEAVNCYLKGISCVLCLHEATVADMHGIQAASGLITVRGGITSIVANLMRSYGKPYICGVANVAIDPNLKQLLCVDTGGKTVAGETISIDGTTGFMFQGAIPLSPPKFSDDFCTILTWARKYKNMAIMSNVSNVDMITTAVACGADQMAMFRSEEAFFSADRLQSTRVMLLTENEGDRAIALAQLQDHYSADILRFLKAVGDKDVVIRLFDTSLSYALPSLDQPSGFEDCIESLATVLGISREVCVNRIVAAREDNAVLGLRGCRLAFLLPHFCSMQAKAIAKALLTSRREGFKANVKILLPMSFSDREVDRVLPTMCEAIKDCFAQSIVGADLKDMKVDIEFGAEIANPRACLRCDRYCLNKMLSFLNFDISALTELTFGITQKQSGRFMPLYLEKHMVSSDPFMSLDPAVSQLIGTAIGLARKQRPDIKFVAFGSQVADPFSVRTLSSFAVEALCVENEHEVSAATVAAAQAAIAPEQMKKASLMKTWG